MTQTLTATQYSLLRGSGYGGQRLLSLFTNRVVFAGQLVTGSFTSAPWASFDYTSITVGAYTDVVDQQVILAGTANDIKKATFRGRIRGVPNATTVKINETSASRGALIYFWVIDSHEIQYVQSKPSTDDPTTAVELVDWDKTYAGLLPAIVGLQTGYAGYVNPSTGYLRLGFDVSAGFAAHSGASISSILFAFPSGTLVAGSLSSTICIMDIPKGEQWATCTFTDSGGRVLTRYFGIKAHNTTDTLPDTGFDAGQIAATLEQGATLTIPAFAGVDDVLNNTFAIAWRANELYNGSTASLWGGGSGAITNKVLTANVATLTSAGHPFAVGQTVIVADVDSTFNGTHVITAITANTFSFAKTNANVGSAACSGMAVVNPSNVDFVGWLNRESDPLRGDMTYGVTSSANMTFTGVGPRMARLTAQLLALVLSASPTRWGDITNLTPWRAIWHFLSRYTTVPYLCDVNFDSIDLTYLFSELSTQGENVLGAVQGLAAQINALVEFLPWGALYIARDVNYYTTGERAALTARAAWTSADVFEITRDIDPNPSVGKTDSDGVYYNSTNAQPTLHEARAPGTAQGEAEGDSTLPSQVLASTTLDAAAVAELELRVGTKFAMDNLSEYLNVTFPDGYVGAPFAPGRSQVDTWTLANVAGSQGVNRIGYDTSVLWTVESTTLRYDPKRGTFANQVRYRRVADVAAAGADTTRQVPAPNQTPIVLPDLGNPGFNWELPEVNWPDTGLPIGSVNPSQLLPPSGKVAEPSAAGGQELLIGHATRAFLLRNVITLSTPQSTEITPPGLGSFLIKQGLIDPYSNFATAIGAMLLTSDGTNSIVQRSTNVAAPVPLWTAGASVGGVGTVIRACKTAGSIFVYEPATPSGSTADILVTFDAGGYAGYSITSGSYSATGGNPDGCATQTSTDAYYPVVRVDIGNGIVHSAGFDSLTGGYTATYRIRLLDSGSNELASYTNLTSHGGWFTWGVTGISVSNVQYVEVSVFKGGFTPAQQWIDNIAVNYEPVGGAANVRYSTTYGASWDSTLILATTPGATGGFDVQRAGTNSFAAGAAAVYRAGLLGGAYNLYYSITGGTANPICIIVPYFTWAGVAQTASTNPDILVGLDALDGSSRSLLWIEGGVTPGTVHDLTPVANFVFTNPNAITVSYQHHIAVTGTVSGAHKEYTTNNQGSTWTERTGRSALTFIRDRRNDTRAAVSGTNKGQLYVLDNGTLYYSSAWGGGSARTMPTTGLLWFDTIL